MILGGLKRIAQTAEMVVPTMCGIYVLAALFVISSNASYPSRCLGHHQRRSTRKPARRFPGVLVLASSARPSPTKPA
ncbi:MAG: alanine:cation symporter family protein [Planctomycetota bacterium]